jgi:gas vesicle protein
LKSGETIHAKVSLELVTESTIRAKIFVNPQSAPKVGRAVSQIAKSMVKASSEIFKQKSEAAMMTMRRIWSDQHHPIYAYIRPFIKGSIEEWKENLMRNVQAWKINSKDSARAIFDDSSLFGTSLKEVTQKIDQQRRKWTQYVMELIDNTPAGENENPLIFRLIDRLID